MTQEEKELLLKDLCARLPYHPIFKLKDGTMPLYNVNTYVGVIDCFPPIKIEDCRLYLRPMSSMTEEEKKELSHYDNSVQRTDFFYSHHIDCRFMIEKGLALEAPKDIYK